MNTKEANISYDGRSTLGRLAVHLEFKRTLPAADAILINNWIARDTDELKIAIMTHAFDGMDFILSQGKYAPKLKLADLKDGQLARVISPGDFKGEIFFRNVVGIHSITGNRYWPSEYALTENGRRKPGYTGPLHLEIELMTAEVL